MSGNATRLRNAPDCSVQMMSILVTDIQAGCVVDSAMAAKIEEMVVAIGDELAIKGVIESGLNRGGLPILTSMREIARTGRRC